MNMKKQNILGLAEIIARPLEAIGSPQRIAILLAIGEGEACVCHLETALGWRQAYISQHLMALRKAGVLADRREGRYVFYRLADQRFLELIKTAFKLRGPERKSFTLTINSVAYPSCECPNCAPALIQIES
jgi:ArsR family transcriptional regulator